MPIATAADLLAICRRLSLLDPQHLDALAREAPPAEPQTLAAALHDRGWLTAYQLDCLLHGREGELRLGPYVLLDRLGEGGMGQVFKARDAAGAVVALKVIRLDRSDAPNMERRFRREIEAAMRLRHPNVVAGLGHHEADGTLALAMELVDGVDLSRLVARRGPLPFAEAADLARQAALGLHHAHEKGLVHRDVKPANLLLATGGTVKVLDLGLARREALSEADASTTLTRVGVVMGTPDYMAPEQIEDCHHVDGRADVYALGCTLYFLLSGKVPFPGGSVARKLTRHLHEAPAALEALRPDVPTTLAGVVHKMMAKRPEHRYRSAAEAAEALANWPFQAPPSLPTVAGAVPLGVPLTSATQFSPFEDIDRAATEGPPPPTARPRRRWPWVALVLLVVGGATLAWWLRPRQGTVPAPKDEPPAAVWTLDQLDAADIPPEERYADQPSELVAVLGSTRLRCPGDPPYARVVVSPDGTLVAAARPVGTVCLWDATTGREIGRVRDALGGPFVSDLAFVPDPDRPGLVVCGDQGRVVLLPYGAEGFRRPIDLAKATGVLPGLAVSADGKTLACAGAAGTVFLWNLDRPAEVTRLGGTEAAQLYAVAISPSGWLAAGGDDRKVRLWRKEGDTWKDSGLLDFADLVRGLAFAPDGRSLAVGGEGPVRVWSVTDLSRAPVPLLVQSQGTVNRLTYSVSGDALLAGVVGGQGGRLWTDLDRGGVPPGRDLALTGAASAFLFPNGRTIVSLGQDGVVRFWDRQGDDWAERWPRPDPVIPITTLAFTPDGRRLFTAGAAGPVHQWQLARGAPTAVPLPQSELARPAAYYVLKCPPGSRQLLAGSSRDLRRWDVADEDRSSPLGVPQSGGYWSVASDPLTDTLAVGTKAAVEIWSLRHPFSLQTRFKATEKDAGVGMLAMTADGRRLASAVTAAGEDIRLWDRTANGTWSAAGRLPASFGVTYGITFVDGGRSLVVATAHGVLYRWDLDVPLKQPAWSEANSQGTRCLTSAAATRTVVTAGADGSVTWRSTDDWNRKREVKLPFAANALEFAADGRHLACGCGNGMVYILRLAPSEAK